ncbi:MAG: hypothetical protein A2W99_08230 [Bacteroidetes bacterium GWF2_33_16]|nr:MAG: hypothetical protein A2X00_11320 [Bacteroidetes bacterium GWE2_32_14]OFY03831.1 MAG: hypothetical protein A2W99_08230 [Bacteroidetes bacterium GWF2_33_16]
MKKIVLTYLLIGLTVIVQAQVVSVESKTDEKKDELIIKVKDGKQPDIYIDGKKYDSEIFELLDQNKIESVSVIKGEQALKEYNAPNGVILVKTKKEEENTIVINAKGNTGKGDPKIIIDGEVSDQKKLEKISPDDIHSISVVKDEKARKEYNAPNGVILVTTKKKHEEKK